MPAHLGAPTSRPSATRLRARTPPLPYPPTTPHPLPPYQGAPHTHHTKRAPAPPNCTRPLTTMTCTHTHL